jgi:hypothetical protein
MIVEKAYFTPTFQRWRLEDRWKLSLGDITRVRLIIGAIRNMDPIQNSN